MPYIKKEKRPALDIIVDNMVKNVIVADGDLNYILFKYAKYHIKPGYNEYKNFLWELNEAAEEIRRRLLVPYELKKQVENGEV